MGRWNFKLVLSLKFTLLSFIFKKVKLQLSVYLITLGTHSMLGILEVKGEATDASASDREIPAWAILRAPQSLAPSPHIPT